MKLMVIFVHVCALQEIKQKATSEPWFKKTKDLLHHWISPIFVFGVLGRYPLHYHMCEDLSDTSVYPTQSIIRKNSIHHTQFRCVTIHGTHAARVSTCGIGKRMIKFAKIFSKFFITIKQACYASDIFAVIFLKKERSSIYSLIQLWYFAHILLNVLKDHIFVNP